MVSGTTDGISYINTREASRPTSFGHIYSKSKEIKMSGNKMHI